MPYEQRQKRWLHAHLVSGEQVALRLRRGETLRGGDLLAAPDGGAIEVTAAPEKVLHVECPSPLELARAAYHLGNRHAAVQLGQGFLRIVEDPVLAEMLHGLGAKVTRIEAPFEPEVGAYGGGHASALAQARHAQDSPASASDRGSDPHTQSRSGRRDDHEIELRFTLVRLLQLVSPTLPVGAYSYSQGLESAVEAGIVHDAADRGSMDRRRARIFRRAHGSAELVAPDRSWGARDEAAVARWNDLFLASRETAELRAETLQMGYSLKRLLMELEGQDEKARAPLDCLEEMAFPTAFAFAVARWHLPAQPALVAYLWAWLENQVMAAIKLVPLGPDRRAAHSAGAGRAPVRWLLTRAAAIADDELGSFAPGLGDLFQPA